MLLTLHLGISEGRKHTDEGVHWSRRPAEQESVIGYPEGEAWGSPYPCSWMEWKPVLKERAQSWAEGQEPLISLFSRRACASLVTVLERCTLAEKTPICHLHGDTHISEDNWHLAESDWAQWPFLLPLKAPGCDFVFGQKLQFLGPNQSMTSTAEARKEKQDWRENQGGGGGHREKMTYRTRFQMRGQNSMGRIEFIRKDWVRVEQWLVGLQSKLLCLKPGYSIY